MGESVSEGIVSRWLKAVGDSVDEGEPVVEVTTDKVDVEVPAPATGRLTDIVAAEGETVAVGATLAIIAPGPASVPAVAPAPEPEAASDVADGGAGVPQGSRAPTDSPGHAVAVATSAPAPSPSPGEAEPVPTSDAPPFNDDQAVAAPPPPSASAAPRAPTTIVAPDGSGVDAAPLARRAAAKNGVDLHTVRGSGPGGIVTKGDVLGARATAGPGRDTTVRVVEGDDAEPI